MKFSVLLTCLFSLNLALGQVCGLEGTVDERIKNCGKAKENFVLVSRDEKGREVYLDIKSNLLWSDRISYEMNHYGSQKACPGELPEAKLLPDLRWRLPTIKEFETAAINGIKTSLPQMNHWFWTSTPSGPKKVRRSRRRRALPAGVFMWSGTDQVSESGTIADAGSARCVAVSK